MRKKRGMKNREETGKENRAGKRPNSKIDKRPGSRSVNRTNSRRNKRAEGKTDKRREERTAAEIENAAENEAEFLRRKQTVLALLNDPIYKPMKLKELAILLDVPRERRSGLAAVLDALVSEGKVGVSSRGKYGKPELFSMTGIFQGSSRGFGFVTVEGREQDIFIPPDKTGTAFDGDEVQVSVEKEGNGQRAEGRVLSVRKRANTELVGIYRKNRTYGFVIPDNQKITCDIFIPEGRDMQAVDGHKVVVHISSFGGEGKNPEGEISEILGHVNDPGVDILSLVKAYQLPEKFPEEVMETLAQIPDYVPEEKKMERHDLRDELMVTIDGEDAKDLDDAVSLSFCEETGLYRLGVHIADVSEYVREGSALDREAEHRGTSVYLLDRVIPMLPHRLSNGICSLNQFEDRLALSCIMWIDRKGHIADHQIAETLIRVDRRMSYTNVNAIIAKNDARKKEQFAEFVPMLLQMKELSGILRERRTARGGIDFDFPESKITLDKKGRVLNIEPYERNAAQLLIEDFMLAANETVAEEYYWRQLPFLYRTHEAPDPEKMRTLSVFVENFGFFIRGGKTDTVHPKALQALLTQAAGKAEEALIARLTLRSMKQARYTTDCTGHFGLAAKYYTHFTSPIRRYPDLQIHRIIKESLHGRLDGARIGHYEALLPQVADDASKRERLADEAERECDKMKKCEYMKRFIGEEFDGIISSVTSFGFYVELPNTCEGLVHVSSLTDDYYVFYENTMELRGERRLKSYKLGQPVHIVVTDADKAMRTVDFHLCGTETEDV